MINLTNIDDSWMLPCMSKSLLGMDCPGCGIQRSISFLMKGQFVDAFFMYPAIYPMILLLIFLTFDLFVQIKHNEKLKLGLVILTIASVLINYGIKLFNH